MSHGTVARREPGEAQTANPPAVCRGGTSPHPIRHAPRGQPKEQIHPLTKHAAQIHTPLSRTSIPEVTKAAYTCSMHRTMKNAAIARNNVPARRSPPLLACTLAQEALTACAHHAITDVGDFTGERSDPDVKTAFVPTPVITSTSALIRMVSKSPDLLRTGE